MKIETKRRKEILGEGRHQDFFIDCEVKALFRLLDKHEIPREHSQAFFFLALALARRYIKNFPFIASKGRPKNISLADLEANDRSLIVSKGRPRTVSLAHLARLIGLPKRKRGRPRTWTPKDYQIILDYQRIGKDRLTNKGTNRVTNREALEAGMRIWNNRHGLYVSDRKVRAMAAEWAKRLPDARKAVRKLPQK